jgi:hypothetical protein
MPDFIPWKKLGWRLPSIADTWSRIVCFPIPDISGSPAATEPLLQGGKQVGPSRATATGQPVDAIKIGFSRDGHHHR